ncbi:YonK family protein [Staphylococcus pseudintermedius]|nr:YonK family protein [Staphylococcus pseudintermedius]
MAKLTNTVSFKNAIIDFENDTITEVTKDTEVFGDE